MPTWWAYALIPALALACYAPSLHGAFIWDDDAHVTRPGLRSLAGLWQIWTNVHATQQYYPLLHTAFWIEHRIWGDSTLGYHLANVALHAASALLLTLILRRINAPGASLAGILFTVHPVCVESVAWISEQKNTLSLVLYLLAALAYLRFDAGRGTPKSRRDYALATLLFAMALLAKSVTATLPAALLVVAWWRRGRISWARDAVPLAPWFAIAAASGLLTAWVERTVIGARGPEFDLSGASRVLLAGRIVWFYLGKLAWPSHLSFVYPRWDARHMGAGWTGYLLAALGTTAALGLAARRARGPLAAWLLFVGSLFPALGFFNVYPFLFSYVADHFQYLASIAFFAAVAGGAATLLSAAGPRARVAGWSAAAAAVAALALLANAQSRTYADEPTLYHTTLERNPQCWMAHENLGVWLERQGQPESAAAEYLEAERLYGDYPYTHNNLGGILLKMPGRQADAAAEFREAIRLKPDFADAHDSLGNALAEMPEGLDEAIREFQESLRLKPDLAEAHNNLGNAWMREPGKLAYAVAEYIAALRLNPALAEARNNLGNALSALGKKEEAVAQYREALRLKPEYAAVHFNIAMALLNVPGRRGEAADELEQYLRLSPANETARRILEQIRPAAPR